MKSSRIILAVTLFAVPTLRAQIVNVGATNTLSNVTINGPSTVTVGTNGWKRLTTQAQPRRTSGGEPRSGTEAAPRRWLQRFDTPLKALGGFCYHRG